MTPSVGDSPLRLAVLHSRLSPHMVACFRALCAQVPVELLVIRTPPADNAPFDERHFEWMDRLYDRSALRVSEMMQLVQSFSPDAVFMSGWFDEGYLWVARRMRRQGVFVVAGSDEQWKGTWRQQGARLIAPWYLHSAIDVLWVAGERQRQFARRLGYRGAQCWEGVYGCDWGQFAAHHSPSQSLPHAFLFVGRYEHEKGLDVLVQAYQRYREQVESPWPLLCAGEGTLKSLLAETAGIHNRGFTQPDDLPALMEQAGAFVLPSRDEPWGVVVEEAAAAGRPLICTEACGAGVHLVRDGHNGYLARPGDPEHLSECLLQMSRISEAKRSRMGTRSHELSKQYTPTQWVETLVTGIQRWYANNHVTERVAAQ